MCSATRHVRFTPESDLTTATKRWRGTCKRLPCVFNFLFAEQSLIAGRFPLRCLLKWGLQMSKADHYRKRAAKFHTKAQNETDPELRIRFENLVRAYLQLAERADRNRQIDFVSEPPPATLLFSWFVTWELPPVLAASLMPVPLTSSAAAPRRPNSKST